MAQVFNKIYVDVRTKNDDIITAVQSDSNSRFLDVYLLDNGSPINLTGHEVRIYGKKADGKEIYNNGTITEATNGRCQFELTDQALAIAQDLTVQIVLYYNNVQILQSLPFTIHVAQSLISDGSIPSSNEYGALVVLYQNLYEAYDLMTTMVQNFGTKGTIATGRNIETFWQALEYMAKYMDTDLTTLLNQVLSEASVQGVIDRLGNTADTGATATTGTVMAKLNGVINFNGNYVEVQKSKSTTSDVPMKVSSGTQDKVSFAVEFEKPVKFDYLQILLSNVVADVPSYVGIIGTIRITYHNDTTRSLNLQGGRWYYQYYLYQSAVFDKLCGFYGQNPPNITLGVDTIPLNDTVYIKKIEIINGYADSLSSAINMRATLNVYYRDKVKMW